MYVYSHTGTHTYTHTQMYENNFHSQTSLRVFCMVTTSGGGWLWSFLQTFSLLSGVCAEIINTSGDWMGIFYPIGLKTYLVWASL